MEVNDIYRLACEILSFSGKESRACLTTQETRDSLSPGNGERFSAVKHKPAVGLTVTGVRWIILISLLSWKVGLAAESGWT